MTNIRIIPTLLMQNKKLVKTTRFKNPQYIGDPINAIRIFNNLFVDEIILLDIHQASTNLPIDFEYLKLLVSECFIPICYGGGISSIETAVKLFSLGIEKLSVHSAAIKDLRFIKQLSDHFGTQSIVGAIDYRTKLLQGQKVVLHDKSNTKYTLIEYAQMLEEHGAGELLVNAIQRDGMMTGYDLEMLEKLSHKVKIPIIASGGAGHLNHMKEVFEKTGINAFAAGSLFVYSGKLKGVLINYPSRQEIKDTFY